MGARPVDCDPTSASVRTPASMALLHPGLPARASRPISFLELTPPGGPASFNLRPSSFVPRPSTCTGPSGPGKLRPVLHLLAIVLLAPPQRLSLGDLDLR